MASFNRFKAFISLALSLTFFMQGTLGGITCEKLDSSKCAFAVSSSAKRCVLENRLRRGGQIEFSCRTSNIDAEKLADLIETDECIKACGLSRSTVGISSDSLLETKFTQTLCSPQCYNVCSNIVDLYFNLAAGEGVFLPKLCEEQAAVSRRVAMEMRSSGLAPVAGPISGSDNEVACAPTQSIEGIADAPAMPPM
ncbi:uncharacterized protein A4U43_C04F9970 [Asparagus officinalis]|uniref:PAR1 protein n=1 Tax=Asparagus officinalis TaxID=4686 RepID=A0A5P1EZP8_ASPOF|nr:uncharacterized protein LOC109839797 [Asparagus officinalis]ONK71566.1 uncharacterized protein A4U43_C04F9970 [Asparagus officinalis]